MELPVHDTYRRLDEAGFGYGPAFRGLHAAWQLDGEVYAEIALPETARTDSSRYGLHPALLGPATDEPALNIEILNEEDGCSRLKRIQGFEQRLVGGRHLDAQSNTPETLFVDAGHRLNASQ